jgi:hypothetical protein
MLFTSSPASRTALDLERHSVIERRLFARRKEGEVRGEKLPDCMFDECSSLLRLFGTWHVTSTPQKETL